MKIDLNVTVKIEGNDLARAIDNLSLGLIGLRFPRSLTFVYGGEEMELKKTLTPNQLRKELQKQAEVQKKSRQEGLAANKPLRDSMAEEGQEEPEEEIKPAKKAIKKKAAKAPEPEPEAEVIETDEPEAEVIETEVVQVTEEEVTAKAKELISVSSPAVLRAVLDGVIGQGVKISGAPKEKYGAIMQACAAKIEELS